MARTNSVNFTGANQFPIANAGTDIFKKEDVQVATKSLDLHDHSPGLGLPINPAAIPTGTITSAMIADGTIQGADIATGTITTTQIADGTIATADLANQAVTNAKLGTDTARLNLLTNPGFDQKQRSAVSNSTSGGFLVDGWALWPTTSTATHTQIGSTIGSQGASLQIAYTHSAGGRADTQSLKIMDGITPQIRSKTLTFTVWVKSTVAGTVRLYLYDDVSSYTLGAYNVGTGAERLTLTATVSASAATVYVGMRCDVASCTVEFNDATLVVGSVAADYAPLHPADDLARCLRYYSLLSNNFSDNIYASGFCSSATQAYYALRHPPKGGTPTITFSAASTFANQGAGFQPTCTAISADNPGPNTFRVATTASGLVAGQGTLLIAIAGGAAIYQEWN